MGSHSVSTPRGLVQWQRLLLVVSLLTFWSLPTTTKISIVSTYVPEGEDTVLRILNKPPEATGIVWYKGEGVNISNIIVFLMKTPSFYLSGPGHSGEEMITSDGFLFLKKVAMKNAGIYTAVVQLPDSKKEIGFGKLEVYDREEWLETVRVLEQIKKCKKRRLADCVW